MIKLLNINFSELSFKLNSNPIANGEIKLSPTFKRMVKENRSNPKDKIMELSCSMLSSYTDPKPFDLTVSIIGKFEVEDDFYLNDFQKTTTTILFPYLRSAISNLMTLANFPPINLPVLQDGILFNEDRENIVTND